MVKYLLHICLFICISTNAQWDAMLLASQQQASQSSSDIATAAPDYDFNAQNQALGAVSSWPNDGSGDASSADQSTGGNQPNNTDESGKYTLIFDGSDHLDLNPLTPTDLQSINITSTDFHVFVVTGSIAATTGTYFGDREASTQNRTLNMGVASSNRVLTQIGSVQEFDPVPASGSFIYEVRVDSGNWEIFIDGVSVGSGSIGSDSTGDGWTIGDRTNNSVPLNGGIRRILVWTDRVLTSQEQTDVRAELAIVNQ